MTKFQLVEAVAARTDLTRRQAADAVDAILETMEDVLSRGGEVALAGFGKFSVAERAARQGQHPRTGEAMDIPRRACRSSPPARTSSRPCASSDASA